jgi:oligopeptide transport system permease protein
VVVYATLTVPAVILQEAFLSFLGLGVQPPDASWGTLIADGARVMALFPWLVVFPGLALSLTLLAFNFMGDGLRDALDPQDGQQRR